MKICAIIPTHNHVAKISDVIAALRAQDLKVIVVDDGSSGNFSEQIEELQTADRMVDVTRLPSNQGKGAAVMVGFELAFKEGFSHALQIDADGQHDTGAISELLSLAKQCPEALITGRPVYDESIPLGRKLGRWITHFWVWIETLSFQITDSMCGFRIYPLQATIDLIRNKKIGRRMDFDTDIMVRLYWRGVDVKSMPVKVIYPEGNTSNFDVWRDNWRISVMHTRLVVMMLLNLPKILARQKNPATPVHWASLQERGTYWGLGFCVGLYRVFGRTCCKLLLAFIVFYFFIVGSRQRRASNDFLRRVLKREPTSLEIYRHFYNFSLRALDNVAAWKGDIDKDTIKLLTPETQDLMSKEKNGMLIVVSHLGNVDISRVTLEKEMQDRFLLLAHTHHAVNFNRALKEFRPEAAMNMLQITDIGPETIMDLHRRLEEGACIVIAGDRTPATSHGHVAYVDFFSEKAPFAHGPWILASLLECPTYLLFCAAHKEGEYTLSIEKFADRVELPRKDRATILEGYCGRYAQRLEHYAAKTPFQWFNFFDFWAKLK